MSAAAKTHLRRLLAKSAFAGGVSVLEGGTAGAQRLRVLTKSVFHPPHQKDG